MTGNAIHGGAGRAGSGRLAQSFLDELRSRVTLSAIVGRRVKLVRAGREFKACCPFHNEKSASFYVNDDKSFFHCFGCGAHGDAIAFEMRFQDIGFMEAVERLAQEAGLAVPKPAPVDAAAEAARLSVLDCLEQAASFFAASLRGSEALAYATRERGLTESELAAWRIGYAGGDVAIAALRRLGFGTDTLLAAGLLGRRDDGSVYPFFRNRLMFPVCDVRARVRGFGGRLLGPGEPKYLNSPASEIFDKGRLLFGAEHARRRPRDARGLVPPSPALVVGEGYLDAIALCGIGYRGVATNGTALTEGHLEALWRLDPEPVIAFDGDRAGEAAMRRVVERALPMLRADRLLRFARLPAGEDPDSARRQGRDEDVRRAIDSCIPLSQALFEMHATGIDMKVPEARARCETALRASISTMSDAALKAAFESTLVYQGVRRFRIVDGGRPAKAAAGPMPDPGMAGARLRADLGRAVVRCILAGGSVVEDLGDELATLGPDVPGLDDALRDPAAYGAGEAGAALLADAALARQFAFLRPGCGALETERGLRFAIDMFACDRLAAELVDTVPESSDAPGWDAYLAKAQALADMRAKLALGEPE